MSGKEFADNCRGVAKCLNVLADQAEGAGDAAPVWQDGTKAETMGMLIDLASDFNKVKED